MLKIIEKKIYDKKMTKTDKKIADYFYENENKLYFMTSRDIGLNLGISDTSVIRFVKSLGFKNFTEFKERLKEKVSDKILTPNEKLSLNQSILNSKNIQENFIEHIEKIILESFEKNNFEIINDTVNILLNSNKKYIIGFKSTSGLASFFGLRVGFLLENVITHPRNNSELIKNIVDITEKDCLLIIAHPKYSKTYNLLLDIAKEKGAKIIIVTDKKNSPVAEYGDVVLINNIHGISYFNSLISTQVLLEYILTLLSTHIDEKMQKRLTIINEYLNKNL
ncbi:MurR/RpiR family transcriptional regulator [Cetobacterium sp. SF1]|uniref:MurR/RpiR family transcriptional regulator n=1 Tax=unclassified Cetobacterium TaxID=2630983 RepID=UPI003CEB8D47